MNLWLAVTDSDWFSFLRDRRPDEVNFWQPSGGRQFRALAPGEPFLFKLHSPKNYVVGGGFFVRHTALPCSLAWEAFGTNNGVPDMRVFRDRIRKYRRAEADAPTPDPVIGCNVLAEPFFWPEQDWIPVPADWAPNIVQGKTYETTRSPGAELWASVLQRLHSLRDYEEAERYGTEFLTRARLGQGAFRVLVTDAYHRRCAITGERTLPVLEAAHIKPYSEEGPHRVTNGLLLRSDLHILFDKGYLTVTPEYRVEVSHRIREEFENGRDYCAHHGQQLLVLPDEASDRPGRPFLKWHNESRFLA
jgi:putative restriction endonuclease